MTDAQLDGLRDGSLDPYRVVFVAEGMLHDLGAPWVGHLRDELAAEEGVLALPVYYWTDPTGVWFNWGSVEPGQLIAHVADEIASVHRIAGCQQPLVFDAIGFSHGCEVLFEAAKRAEHTTFRRVVLEHASSFAFSGEAGDLIREGRIQSIRNHWSPVDGMTLLAPLGAGALGIRPTPPGVENVMDWRIHMARTINRRVRDRMRLSLNTPVVANPPNGPPPARDRPEVVLRFREGLARHLEFRRHRAK